MIKKTEKEFEYLKQNETIFDEAWAAQKRDSTVETISEDYCKKGRNEDHCRENNRRLL